MIYVTLPVHNEQQTIGVLLWRLRQVFADLSRDFRILVLDDGSTDDTWEVLEPYRAVLPLTVLRHERRLGYAASVERLVREAVRVSRYPKRDGLLVMQADFTDGPEWIPDMLRRFQGGADLVAGRAVGVREAPGRVRLVRFAATLVGRPSGVPAEIDDLFCSFRLFRLMALKRALGALPDQGHLLHHEGWAANMELLSVVAPHLRRLEQLDVPIDYTRRYRTTRFRPLHEMWAVVRAARDGRLRSDGRSPLPERG